jgi:DNA-directed RNA polymerase specialized sigma24 family protein
MREVLELHLGGLSADEIAERLRIAPKTVYDLQEKARARVLLLLAPADGTEPLPDRPTPSNSKVKSAIEAAMRPLPSKIREVLDALHGKGLSPRKAASELRLKGPDQVIRLRDEGYRLLSQKLGLPFPESFDYLT